MSHVMVTRLPAGFGKLRRCMGMGKALTPLISGSELASTYSPGMALRTNTVPALSKRLPLLNSASQTRCQAWKWLAR